MQNRNPYAAPQTNVARGESAVEEFGDVKVFSVSGRIGRVRYIAHSIGLSLLVMILAVLLAGMASIADESAAIAIVVIGYIAMYAIVFVPGIQRSHDMNVTGWLSLISLIPLGVLVFWFVPGTRGENDYGKQPPPNTVGAIVLACIVPVFMFVVGILAAIAIPAYQDYTIRAQVSEGLNLASQPKAAVADVFRRTGAAPADRLDAGMSPDATDSGGQYVESVDIAGGTIVVTYSASANSIIAGRLLAMQPYTLEDNTVVWRCGAAASPGPDAVPMDRSAPTAAEVTNIEPRHLPSACRP
jgi:type IV pilus assembly protein PilA